MLVLSANPAAMGPLPVRRKTRVLGWGAVALMAVAVAMMGRELRRCRERRVAVATGALLDAHFRWATEMHVAMT